MKYNILIIGYGSIAKRHHYVLNKILHSSNYYALRSSRNSKKIEGVNSVYNINEITNIKFDFIIISNPTTLHYDALKNALSFNCPIFIEKPVLSNLNNVDNLISIIKEKRIVTYVGCNLRFNKTIRRVKKLLESETVGKIYEVNVYCGSDVSKWRPNQKKSDLINTINLSGGVNIDLIHELDYTYWFFGLPNEVKLFNKNVSSLKINVPDFSKFILDYNSFIVSVSLNYFRKDYKRTLEIVGSNGTLFADIFLNQIRFNNKIIFSEDIDDPYYTYHEQMKYFIGLIKNRGESINSFYDGIKVLKISLGEDDGNIKK